MNVNLVSRGDRIQCGVLQELLVALGERSIGFYSDVVLVAELDRILVEVKRMSFDLVHNRL